MNPNEQTYTYLKLGGSLITDKQTPLTASKEIIEQLASEISNAQKEDPSINLILGHGSGSFGHSAAKKYGTVNGVHSVEDWIGYSDVWYQARTLNQIVTSALHQVSLPVISIDISTQWKSNSRKANKVDLSSIKRLLKEKIIPVFYGNVLLDETLGGTIFSTEMIFAELCKEFTPQKILVAGIEDGIWEDYPQNSKLIEKISPDTLEAQIEALQGSRNTDVTGGMRSKVETLLPLLNFNDTTSALIYNGRNINNTKKALLNEPIMGTWLTK